MVRGRRGARGLGVPGVGAGGAGSDADTGYGILHGIYWLVANLAQDGPLLLAVDDAQWADEASLRFLAHLVPRIDAMPAMLAIASRPATGRGRGITLERLLADRSADRLDLAPLSAEAVLALTREELGPSATPAFAAACRTATGGNPLYLRELIRELASRGLDPGDADAGAVPSVGPAAVARAVRGRLASLPAPASDLAAAVAVLGDGAPLRRAAALAGLSLVEAGDAADALAAATILTSGVELGFVHPIVRAAVESALPAGRRAANHARAASLLAADGEPADRVAAHLLATAGTGDAARVELLAGAAAEALARGAPEVAVAYLTRALAEPPTGSRRAEVLHDLGAAELRAGGHSVAGGHLREALQSLDDLVRRADAARQLATVGFFTGDGPASVDLLIAELDGADYDREQRLLLTADLGTIRVGVSPASMALVNERVRAMTVGVGDRTPGERLFRAVLGLRASSSLGKSAAEAAAESSRTLAADLMIDHPESFIALAATMNAAITLVAADRLETVEAFVTTTLVQARRRGLFAAYQNLLELGAYVGLQRGSLREAEGDAQAAFDAAGATGKPQRGVAMLAWVLVLRDDAARADSLIRDHDLTGAVGPEPWNTYVLLARAQLRLAQGRLGEAIADLSTLEERDRQRGALRMEPPWRAWLALALARAGDRDEAVRRAGELETLAGGWGTPRSIGVALRTRALLTSDGDEADGLLARSIAALRASPARLELARSLAAAGGLRRRRGWRRDARVALREALALAHAGGATVLEREIGDELAATGARIPRRTGGGVDALTASELRIARMAASGLSNRDIAQALFVTTKTVEMHLANTYRKLDVRSRGALPAALRPEADVTP